MKTVTLNRPYLGYRSGELTGNMLDYRHEIQLTSGLRIYLYEDEFTID